MNRVNIEQPCPDGAMRADAARFEALMDALGILNWTGAPDGRIATDSPRWRAFTGPIAETGLGDDWLAAVHPEDVERIRALWQGAIATPVATEMTCRLRRHDGVYRHFLVRCMPLRNPDGQLGEWVGACLDITDMQNVNLEMASLATEQSERERALHRSNHRLQHQNERVEDEVTRRTEELERANVRLREADRLKDEFIGVVSHELRTPLTSIRSAMAIIAKGKAGPLTESQAKFTAVVLEQSERLGALVDDLLDLQKLEAGVSDYHMANQDVGALVAEVCEGFAHVLDARGLAFTCEARPDEAHAWGDRRRLGQVLMNLLSNAAKFTAEGGSVHVTVSAQAGEVHVCVADTGMGIAAADLPRLFRKFVQLDAGLNRPASGTGLGLAICRTLIEEGHHGRIWTESRPGEGSRFTFALPLIDGVPASPPALCEPALPANEVARLALLHSLGVLDTAREERFERITRLAMRLFDVPIAAVTLIDAERQWFKSCQGLDVSETPRSVSFCGHAILSPEPLVVPDARLDPRFAGNPFVGGAPGVCFYAGHPLVGPDGLALGALCVIDMRPRHFSAADRASLRDLAAMVLAELLKAQP